ncbi:amino acid adenylation domain-containing protein [Kitasatospora sp. NPDC056138]|uniref:non-ribosomal peptide synthetase n=1 Tax=Kitasatospora sp. NPDC056138 TaxID=3345724 RepID=UPI0035D5E587
MTTDRSPFSTEQAALLARRLRGGRRSTGDGPGPVRRPEGAPAELSLAQLRLWFLEQLQPGSIGYVMPDTTYRLLGPLDVAALETALRAVASRHTVLRSHFEDVDGQPRVVLEEAERIRLDLVDVSTAPVPERAVADFVRTAARTPFDLTTGPLLRPTLLRLGTDDHVLQVTVHHSVFDGWSIQLFEADLTTAYRAALAGTSPNWPALELDYADFASWQRESLSPKATADHLAYWRDRLADAPPALELPTDRSRPPVPSQLGHTVPLVVPADVTGRLRELAHAHRATLFMTTLAAYHVLLGRHARTEDVVVGCPSAGRDRPELEQLIGFFVNSLPIRANLDADRPFTDLLDQVRDTTFDAFAHQDLGFDRLVEELAPPRDLSRNPVIQSWFDLFTPGCRLHLEKTAVEKFPARWYTTRFDLELHLVEHEDGTLHGHLVYAVDLFEESTMERLAEHYVTLLSSIAHEPRRPLRELALSGPDELDRLLHGWNDTATDFDTDTTVIDEFERQAARTPQAPALVFGDEQLSFRELNSRANQVARQLQDEGVGPETVVGLLLPRGTGLVVALLGVLKAGGAYLPLDPQHPEDRIAFMLDDTRARLVLAAPELADRLPPGVTALPLPVPHDRPHPDPRRGTTPDNLIYVIYTSGSTGRPKGVAMTHRPLVNLLRWQLDRCEAAGPTLQFSAINFDISFQEMFSSWLAGGSVVLVTEEQRRDPGQLLDTMQRAGTRRLFCPPMVLEQIAQAAGVRDELPPLTEIQTAGEQLHLSGDILDLLDRLPNVRVDNQYGPTEAHVITAHLMTGDPLDWPAAPPVGRPIANTRVYVLDEGMRPTPVGIPGEVYVGGICLARGYLGRADLTADRFLPDPFATEPGERLYRTGDLGCRQADGTLRFLGRADDQVKIRGYRIEPGEIVALLDEHPEVAEAAVVPAELVRGDLRLAAYVVPAPGASPTVAGLRGYLEEKLPDYMVPSYVVFLPKLPLTGPGKLDRKALPLPDRQSGAAADFTAPRDEREAAMARIWAEATGLAQVGIHDDFFDLGGHSLLATRVTARVSRVFGVDLPLRAIFTHRTVARLTAAVGGSGPLGERTLAPRAPGEEPVLSFAQQRLWFLDRLQTGTIAYVMPDTTYRIQGPLDVAALRTALRSVLDRHAVLRSHFEDDGGEARIRFAPSTAITVEQLDLSGSAEPLEAALEFVRTAAHTPFDLTTGPLVRLTLLRLGDDDHVLQMTVHHAVFDGFSIYLFEEELTTAYRAAVAGAQPGWPPLTVDYADFAAWQRETLTDEAAAGQAAYWREALGGAPAALELPTDHPRPPLPSYRGGSIRFTLAEEVVTRLREAARGRAATLFMVTAAAYQVLLGRYAGTEDVVIGCPAAGRSRPELEELIGFFVNSLPLRADLSGDPRFGALLDQVRDTTLDAFAHQGLPFERLVEELAPPRDLGRNPVFQAWFDLFTPGCRLHLDGTGTDRFVPEWATTRFDLELRLAEQEDGSLSAELVYAADLFDRPTMELFAEHYAVLVASIAADPDRPLSELAVAGPAELERILTDWNDSALPDADPGATVVGRFEQHARRTPEATALIAGNTRLSYRELGERADRIAAGLRARGIGVESLVGVCLPRTADLPVALLAVAKAGAGYLALDPGHPAERLRMLTEDSGAALVITSGESTVDWTLPATTLAELDRAPGADPAPAGPGNVLYVVHTSGSTGRPKGVVMQHGPTALLMHWAAQRYQRAPVALQYFPVTSDVCSYELWSTWWTGGTVVLADETDRFDPARLAALIQRHRIGTVLLPGAVLHDLAAHHRAGLGSLREVITTGDRFTVTGPIRELGVRVDNQWGSTEVNVVTAGRLSPPARDWPTTPGIGSPVAAARIYVLDEHLRPVPADVPGQLYVGGTPLARGYLGRPDLTAASFLPDPLATEPGARMYRTGDRGRWRPDGTLEFLGRADFQLKIHGYRVDPGEIETVLQDHPAVTRAAVTAHDTGSGTRLAAHLAAAAVDADELRDWLRHRLPEHMIPQVFSTLPELPTTSTGKVDRGALPAPDFRAAAGTAPRTRTEERIAGIWREVLGRGEVGVHDDFFDLGGHSLLCIQVLTRINLAFDTELPLRTLFTHRTVARLSEAVVPAAAPRRPAPTARTSRAPRVPSFAQQRLWFLEQLQPGLPAYLVPCAYRLLGPLDTAALARAFDTVLTRHEALRSRFQEHDGELTMVVDAAVPLATVDLSGADDPQRAARDHVARAARTPFDLSGGPLVRATLLRLAPQDHVLEIVVHHAVFDGLSRQILTRELSAAYRSKALPEPTLQYADFAAWQRETLSGEVSARHAAYWRTKLADAPPALELPTDHPRPPVPSYRGGVVTFTVGEAVTKGLRELAHTRRATLFMTALAAYHVLLARHARTDDVVVGCPSAGRDLPELEKLIGFFVNSLPLRAELSANPSFTALLDQVRDTTLDALAHQDLPFERLVEELAPPRDLSRNPVVQTWFQLFETDTADRPDLPGLSTAAFGDQATTTRFDLELHLTTNPDGTLTGELVYATDLFDDSTMRRFAEHYTTLLDAVVRDPGLPVHAVPLSSPAELDLLLHTWNETGAAPADATIAEEFERQAARTPGATALVHGHQRWSYADLDDRADRIARQLGDCGPESVVGVLLPRSAELVAVLLGVLKAGAAYLPLDPQLPGARIDFMLSDARARTTVTTPELARLLPEGAPALLLQAHPAAGKAPRRSTPANLAYLVFTSGSTGRPKGVAVTNASLLNLVRWHVRTYGLGPGEVVSQVASPSFDAAAWEIWPALLSGACLHLPPDETVSSPPDLVEHFAQAGTTVTFVPTPLAEALLEHPLGERTSVRSLLTGGDAFRPRPDADPGVPVVNHYGPTESTVVATATGPLTAPWGRPPIGSPIANVRTYVLDESLDPVGVGVPGELFVGGAGVARGYLGRPALTAERFVPDPFGPEPGARLYRTGDLVRRREDGSLQFLGRTDDQVKIRGYRIEPGEIEAALLTHPGVRGAVVAAKPSPGGERLVAYLVPVRDLPPAAELTAHLGRLLPRHLLPSAFLGLTAFPLTPSGKVDRRALPQPDRAGTVENRPRTPGEEAIAGIVAEVLGGGEVGIHDDFFDLGGHSLLATKVTTRIGDLFGVALPLRAVFEHRTVAGLGAAVEAAVRAEIEAMSDEEIAEELR